MAKKSKSDESLLNGPAKWVLVFIGLLALFFVSYYAFSGIGKVNYENLVFTKDRFGDIPIYRYTYNIQSEITGKIITYRFYTRIDPSENNVPYNNITIVLPAERNTIYLGLDEVNLKKCGDNTTLAVIGLAQFISSNQFNLVSGLTDKTLAEATNRTHVNCDVQAMQMKIIVEKGNTTQISKLKNNCYTIEYSDCSELLAATEKFEVRAIVDAKRRAGL